MLTKNFSYAKYTIRMARVLIVYKVAILQEECIKTGAIHSTRTISGHYETMDNKQEKENQYILSANYK